MLPHRIPAPCFWKGRLHSGHARFGLLIPIHIAQSSLGGTPLSRFGRVTLAQHPGQLLGGRGTGPAWRPCYEATEVIMMSQ